MKKQKSRKSRKSKNMWSTDTTDDYDKLSDKKIFGTDYDINFIEEEEIGGNSMRRRSRKKYRKR